MCEEGNWEGVDTYTRDSNQPVTRSGRTVLEQCTSCSEYRERLLSNVLIKDDE